MMNKNIFLLFFSISVFQAIGLSQNEVPERHLSFSASAGVVSLTSNTYAFQFRYLSSQTTPGLSTAVDVCYGDFVLAGPTLLQLSAEYRYTRASTEDPAIVNRHSQMRASQHAGIIWARMKVASSVAPSLKVGMGAARFEYAEEFLDVNDKVSAQYWSPVLAMGTALDVAVTKRIMISPSVDLTYALQIVHVTSNSGRYQGSIGEFLFPSYGVRLEVGM